jgi:hypothetical protein
MRPHFKPVRHARLFELLRQQNMSEMTAMRLRARVRPRIGQNETRRLLGLAEKSWRPMLPAGAAKPSASAAKSGRDHKFFRAVRA